VGAGDKGQRAESRAGQRAEGIEQRSEGIEQKGRGAEVEAIKYLEEQMGHSWV